jgi:hypothetical protein
MKITKKTGGSRTVIVILAGNMHERVYSKAAGPCVPNRRLCLSASNDAEWECQHRRGCRTGGQREARASSPNLVKAGTPSVLITPAPHRTLIPIKVPCSIGCS